MKKTYKKFAWGGFNFGDEDDNQLTPEQQETFDNLDPQGQENYLNELGYESDNPTAVGSGPMNPEDEIALDEKKAENKGFDPSKLSGGTASAAIFNAIGDSAWTKDGRGRMGGNEAVQRNASARSEQFSKAGNSVFPGLGGMIGSAVGGIVGALESGKVKKNQIDANFSQDTADAATLQARNKAPNARYDWNELAEGGTVTDPPDKKINLSTYKEQGFYENPELYKIPSRDLTKMILANEDLRGNEDEFIANYNSNIKKYNPTGNELFKTDNLSKDGSKIVGYKGMDFTPLREVVGLAEGGKVKGAGTEKSDSIAGALPEGSFVVPAENTEKAERLRKVLLGQSTSVAKPNSGLPVKLSKNEHVFMPHEVKKLQDGGVNLDSLAPNSDSDKKLNPERELYRSKMKDKKIAAMIDSDADDYLNTMVSDDWTNELSETEIESLLKSPEYSQYFAKGGKTGKGDEDPEELVAYMENRYGKDWRKKVSEEEIGNTIASKEYQDYIKTGDLPGFESSEDTGIDGTMTVDANLPPVPPKGNTGQKILDAFGGTAGAAALAQLGFGLANQLIEGERPQSSVDGDLLARLDDAKKFDNRGFSAERKAQILANVESSRLAGNQSAVNVSGGNASVALAGQRAINSDAFNNVLKTVAADQEMMMQNKGRTDNLALAKAGATRQVLQDALRGFDQNQAANADLIGAGLHNFVGNLNYREMTKEKPTESEEERKKRIASMINGVTSQTTTG